MSNQPYRSGAFEIPCRASDLVVKAPPAPGPRPPTWAISGMASTRPVGILAASGVALVGLWALLRVWARTTEAWTERLRTRYGQRLDRGLGGPSTPSGEARA